MQVRKLISTTPAVLVLSFMMINVTTLFHAPDAQASGVEPALCRAQAF